MDVSELVGGLDLANGAHSMVSAKLQLERVALLFGGVAKELNEVGIPHVEPKYSEVMGFHVVTGVDVSMYRVLEGPAKKLSDGADTVTAIVGDLDALSVTLRELSDILGVVGDAMSGLGQRLSSSGGAVRTLVGGID
jgi:hypothetical protein